MDESATQSASASHPTVSLDIPDALPVDDTSRDREKTDKYAHPANPDVPVLQPSKEKDTAEKANLAEITQLLKPSLWKWFVNPIGAYHAYVLYRFFGDMMDQLAANRKKGLDELEKTQREAIEAAEAVATKAIERAKVRIEENDRLNEDLLDRYKTQADKAISDNEEALKAGNAWKAMALKADSMLEKCAEVKRKKVEELIVKVFWEGGNGEKKDVKAVMQDGKDENILDEDYAITKAHLEKLANLDELMDDVATLAQELVDIQKGLDYDLMKKNAPEPLARRSKAIYHPLRNIRIRIAQLCDSHIKNHPKPRPGVHKYTWNTPAPGIG